MVESTWRIDAIDALGGAAFASFRTADLLGDDANLDNPCYILSAPDFRPEPLTSRALAFSAARRGYQFGLWEDGEEIGFKTLEAIVEFVRRVYLTASGRGGGGDMPPYPTEPGPRPEGPPARGIAGGYFIQQLIEVAERFVAPAVGGSSASLTMVEWPTVKDRLSLREMTASLCAYAAVLTLDEIVGRLVQRRHDDYPRCMRSLATAIDLVLHFGGGDDSDLRHRYERGFGAANLDSWWMWDRRLHYGWCARIDDVVGTLEFLPVDRRLAKALGHKTPDRASVFDVMRILIANPKELFSPNLAEAQTRLSLLFFGSTIITHAATPYRWEPYMSSSMIDAESVWDWLVAQLPQGHFTEKVERLISNVGLPVEIGRASPV